MKSFSALPSALFVLFSAACSPSQGCSSWGEGSTAYVYIDDPHGLFSEEDTEQIKVVLAEWQGALDDHVVFQFVDGDDVPDSLITFRPDTLENLQRERDMGAVTDYTPLARGGDITLPYDVDSETFRLLTLHETGHALGLDHDGPGTVMVSGTGFASDSITCQDVCQFCEVNGGEDDEGNSDCVCAVMPPCSDSDYGHSSSRG